MGFLKNMIFNKRAQSILNGLGIPSEEKDLVSIGEAALDEDPAKALDVFAADYYANRGLKEASNYLNAYSRYLYALLTETETELEFPDDRMTELASACAKFVHKNIMNAYFEYNEKLHSSLVQYYHFANEDRDAMKLAEDSTPEEPANVYLKASLISDKDTELRYALYNECIPSLSGDMQAEARIRYSKLLLANGEEAKSVIAPVLGSSNRIYRTIAMNMMNGLREYSTVRDCIADEMIPDLSVKETYEYVFACASLGETDGLRQKLDVLLQDETYLSKFESAIALEPVDWRQEQIDGIEDMMNEVAGSDIYQNATGVFKAALNEQIRSYAHSLEAETLPLVYHSIVIYDDIPLPHAPEPDYDEE